MGGGRVTEISRGEKVTMPILKLRGAVRLSVTYLVGSCLQRTKGLRRILLVQKALSQAGLVPSTPLEMKGESQTKGFKSAAQFRKHQSSSDTHCCRIPKER